jgi:hypothetical protein
MLSMKINYFKLVIDSMISKTDYYKIAMVSIYFPIGAM